MRLSRCMCQMMNRRYFLAGSGSLLLSACSTALPRATSIPRALQSEIILFKDSQNPLRGKPDAAVWMWPGVALTANTSRLSADYLKDARLLRASWVVVWNPKCNDANAANKSAIRLVSFDNGPANIKAMAVINVSSGVTAMSPRVDVRPVTTQFNTLLSDGVSKQVGHQTMGNGSEGCLIYGSWLELVWSLV